MSRASLISLVVLVCLLLGGMLVYKSVTRGRTSGTAQADALALVSGVNLVRDNRATIEGYVSAEHDAAFASAYTGGGLFAPSEFDEEVYLAALLTGADGSELVLRCLAGLPVGHAKSRRDFGHRGRRIAAHEGGRTSRLRSCTFAMVGLASVVRIV